MRFNTEEIPYLNAEENNINFEKKRFEFWLETVPADIRRLEFDLFIRQRKLFHADIYRNSKREKNGRFTLIPKFTEDVDRSMWEAYKESFLRYPEGMSRLEKILEKVRQDIPGIIKEHSNEIQAEKIQLIALGGSGFYGPRRAGEFLSDIDLNFLINEETSQLNFEQLPDASSSDEFQYHIRATGKADEARGENYDIHWLLYPHFPIKNEISDKDLKIIIQELIEDTRKRRQELLNKIDVLNNLLKEKAESLIIG
ncbi:MAG: hypothetical protein WC608_02050 [Parcubacteria group bacterium]